ncbi:MAG: ribonuclease H-like domain-containing protein [Candidatus Woesearchaeota archaeon]|nr:MAG: ribonuclease H-like domain-containing protein [Candidatus Woesearchaeota archaeon]
MENVKFYPLDFVAIKNGIKIFGKKEDGKDICVIDKSLKPYFYVITEKEINSKKFIDKITKIEIEDNSEYYTVLDALEEKKNFLGKSINAIKVIVDKQSSISEVKNVIKNLPETKQIIETDISYSKRYLIEREIIPLALCKVEGDLVEDENIEFNMEGVVSKVSEDSFDSPKILAFDIEAYGTLMSEDKSKKDPIITVALIGNNGFKKAITWKNYKNKESYVEIVESEAHLIEALKQTIKEFNPDYLVGYFSDGFDLPYIIERAKKYKIEFNIGKDNSSISFSRGTRVKHARMSGVVHLDLLPFISKIMGPSLQLDSFSLDNVAQAILNDSKIAMNFYDINKAWEEGRIKEIIDYNLQDVKLTLKICEKILPNMAELVKISGLPLYDISRVTYGKLVEHYLMKRAREFNELVPNKPEKGLVALRRTHTYQGAFVMEPNPGLYENLVMLDFRSLYPSIINSKNISPATLNFESGYKSPEIEDEEGKNVSYYYEKKPHFIPLVIGDIIKKREVVKEALKKDKKNEVLKAKSYGLKTIGNAIYGYYAFFGARWYCRECASSITAFAREYIKDVIQKAAKAKFNPIYSDTDSVALSLEKNKEKDVLSFLNKINKELPGLMELELEDFYVRGIFVAKKGEEGKTMGAKKKYALINKDGDMKVIGFETVRKDWSQLARETQLKVLEIILKENKKEKALKFVRKIIGDLRDKKVKINDLILHNQLKMNLEDYRAIGPHVAIARKMKEKGYDIKAGTTVAFVISKGKGMIRDKAKLPEECEDGDYDEDYYINNQIVPCVERIFEVLGYKKEDLLTNAKQKSLGEF